MIGKCLNQIALLLGTFWIAGRVVVAAKNILSLVKLTTSQVHPLTLTVLLPPLIYEL